MMQQDMVLCGARVVDPVNGIDEIREIGIRDGRFAALESLKSPRRVDLRGLVLAPGFIDLHVHLREPGQTHKEDIGSATRAAAAGGFTTVLAMPNTAPPIDTAERVQAVRQAAAERGVVHVLQAGALTLGRAGKELAGYASMQAAGVPALTDDGSTPQDSAVMWAAMQAAAALGLPIVDHCEDIGLSKPGVMHAGATAALLQLPGQPRSAEEAIVTRDIALARETGCRVHLQHLSTAGAVQELRAARQEGLPVSGEVAPHHLFLTDAAAAVYGVNAKMAPPLREES
ncbi:MAG TPA: amidohydrolase family protein, partial [Lentisphaeria bacterium]|nr:amidohydrolase family protein [Lentisphaeria bacterium]